METERNAAGSLSVSAAGRGLHALGRPRVLPQPQPWHLDGGCHRVRPLCPPPPM